jgi:hypothetical protein
MYPSRLQVKQLYWQIVDDPGASVFTDVANPATGAVSVFQMGFSQAVDVLFNNALLQQVPAVEQVTQGIIVPPSPVPFSMTPAQFGLSNFADFEWVSERAAFSNEKFIDLWDEDRLTQRAPTDRLLEYVWQDQAFQFVGCTTVRELQIKWVSSDPAPTSDSAVIQFDNSLNFLANFAAGVTAHNKGYTPIAQRCLSFAIGPKMDFGVVGGELYRLLQPLVRSRQNVQVAHRPYTVARRRIGRWQGVPYVAVQAGTTGGGAQNVPQQFSSANGTIIGNIDGVNATFWLSLAVLSMAVYRNGDLQTIGVQYFSQNNQFTFLPGSIPQSGDLLTAEAYPSYS